VLFLLRLGVFVLVLLFGVRLFVVLCCRPFFRGVGIGVGRVGRVGGGLCVVLLNGSL